MTKASKEGQRKAPILRFKGFTDDWEQRKLKNLITEPLSYGLNVSSKEYDGIHKYLRITDIDEKSRKFNKDKLTSPDIKFNSSSKKYLLSNNDIVFARTGASTGKTYMYQKEDGIVYYAGFLIKASLSSNFDNNFIFQQTYRKRYYQRVKVISQRSGQPGINSKEYGNFDFLITQIEEQNKIGKLFKIFDNLLALYERKLKLLSQAKKYFLDNLFAEKEYPNLRFKEFTDAWEQRKLKNLITEPLSYGLNVSSKEYDGIHKYLRITDIDEKSRKFNKDKLTSPDIKFNSSSKKYLLSNNDIVFARTGASTGKTYMYQKEDGIVYYAGFLIKASLSSNFDNNFIFQQTYRKRYYQRVKVISQRSGQPGINSKEYGNFDFLITQIEEQNKIGKLFKIFDNLLALYENKKQNLIEIKKSLLNTMFI